MGFPVLVHAAVSSSLPTRSRFDNKLEVHAIGVALLAITHLDTVV
jgi:hypothetical protein